MKVWLKSVLPLLKYRIFSRGLFFYWRTLYIHIPNIPYIHETIFQVLIMHEIMK